MKIESGRYYKTRGGKKAFVAATENPFCDAAYPMCGYIEGMVVGAACWTERGSIYRMDSPNTCDLIAEWKEPVTVTKWMLLWSDNTTSVHDSPPSLPLSHLRAIKQVTITEGEGMQ